MRKHSDTTYVSGDIADALTSKNPTARAMARLVATGFTDQVAAWGNAETERPDYKPSAVLAALAKVQMQTYASFAEAMLTEEGAKLACQAYCEEATKELALHLGRMAEFRREGVQA